MSEYILTPEDQRKMNNMADECVDSWVRQQGEIDFRKDVADRAKEELGFKAADFNALVKERYDSKSTDAIEKHQDIVDLNEMLLTNRAAVSNQEED